MLRKSALALIALLLIITLVGCVEPETNDSNTGVSNYTITFNSNGGSSVSSITRQSGSSVSAPSNPTKSGYTFDGWYTTSTLTTKVYWPVTLNSNSTYYAGWKANVITTNYTITFNSNGGSSVSSITRQSGSFVSAPSNPTKSGYTFDGWYTTSALTTKVSWPITLNSNRTYYAGWKANVITTNITRSNFSTYFSATVTETKISTSTRGSDVTLRLDVNKKQTVKSISSTIYVTFDVTISYQYYNGSNTYSGTAKKTVSVSLSSLSSLPYSTTFNLRLDNYGPLANYKITSFTFSNVSGQIT